MFGRLYTWGDCSHDGLGHQKEDQKDLFVPKFVEAFSSKRILDVAVGFNFTIVTT